MSIRQAAAANNAHWCDLVCCLHGLRGRFTSTAWINSGKVPPLYPNCVTTVDADRSRQLTEIERLVATAPTREVAIKDSFRSLELGPLGFKPLFDAEWYCSPALSAASRVPADITDWVRLDTAEELFDWEAAWRTAGSLRDLLPKPLFPPLLLKHDGVSVFARRKGKTVVAGAIAYRSQGVIGLTNFFCPPEATSNSLSACLAIVAHRHSDTAIVGYERPGFASEHAVLGIAAVGALRVWLRPADGPTA